MVNAKLRSSYFGQDGLMFIPQGSVNVYKFFENHTIILVHVSFIIGISPFTIPIGGLFHYKSGVPSVAGVVKLVGQFKWYSIAVKNAITLFNFLVRTGEGLSMNRCCNMYVGQGSNSPR